MAALGVTTVLSACAGGTVGLRPPDATGVYALERVNDVALPARVTAGSCPLTVSDGELSIVPQVGETRPLYVLFVFARPECASFEDRPAPEEFARDFGDWQQRATHLELASRRGSGTYPARFDVESGRPAVTFELDGRSYRWRFARSHDEPVSPMSISVVDTTGHPVDGAFLEIRGANGLVARGVTNGGRAFLSGTSAGRATVRVAPPPQYEIARGQENPVSVAPLAGQETPVRVVLARRDR